MRPEELIKTQKGARLYWLWEREKNPQKKEKYQEEFNKLLEGDKAYERVFGFKRRGNDKEN